MNNERILRDLERLAQVEKIMGGLSFPPFIDSTGRAQIAECAQKYNYSTIQKLTPKAQSVHLVFGASYARGLEVARKAFYGRGVAMAEIEPLILEAVFETWGSYQPMWGESGAQAKTLDTCIQAIQYYFERWPMEVDTVRPYADSDGKPAVEFTFAMPIPEVPHPETGDPLLYVGRYDMLADVGGDLFVEDDKTTGQLGNGWSRRWELRSQFTGYCAAAQYYGYDVVGALIRGVAIYKTKFEGAQAITYRPQWQIDRWYHQLVKDLKRTIEMWKTGEWEFNLDDACSSFGGCPFLELCNKEHPASWIEGYYSKRDWNPLAKD